jgi:hypothetical protein
MYVTEPSAEQLTDFLSHSFCSKMLHSSARLGFALSVSLSSFFSYFCLFVLLSSLQNCVVIRFMFFTPHQTFFSCDETKENDVSEACDTYGEEEKWAQNFCCRT